MFAPAQLLHNWQRLSNQGDLDSSVMGEVGRECCMGVDLFLFSFLYCSTGLLLGCVLNGTPCSSQSCARSYLAQALYRAREEIQIVWLPFSFRCLMVILVTVHLDVYFSML
jgi:hypothetical protein